MCGPSMAWQKLNSEAAYIFTCCCGVYTGPSFLEDMCTMLRVDVKFVTIDATVWACLKWETVVRTKSFLNVNDESLNLRHFPKFMCALILTWVKTSKTFHSFCLFWTYAGGSGVFCWTWKRHCHRRTAERLRRVATFKKNTGAEFLIRWAERYIWSCAGRPWRDRSSTARQPTSSLAAVASIRAPVFWKTCARCWE